ncbi:head morphogenesis protein SPP1 gp7 [Actinobacteria bacterium OV450]|nr:head morphogenesis protein SPP1 gp7 [Actinobacteria bacterium OV450]
MADRNAQLDREESDFTDAVARALADTADEFASAVADATELVAARFSVSRIARMWQTRVTGLVRRLLGTAETAAEAAAEDAGTELPDGWDDLAGRYDDGRLLPDGIAQYVTATERLLGAVGDRLAEAARAELAAGIAAGEDTDQLRDRLRAAFARDGAALGPAREQRIAQTEATRAWNMSTLAAARDMTGPDRPLIKQWVTRHDTKVRATHDAVDGQIALLAEPFTVGGVPMQAPGDPTAPAGEVINCRCRLEVAPQMRASAFESEPSPRLDVFESEENRVEAVTAAAGAYSGAMIALMPTPEDAARLALTVPGCEPAHELHLTLFYLGEGADWDPGHRADLVAGIRDRVEDLAQPLAARVFGANQWNADTDSPCWVYAVGDDRDVSRDDPRLENARWIAVNALEDMHRQPPIPTQHSPWQPHVCAAYSGSPDMLADLNERLGPVTFDRIRIAFAGEHTDIPLGPPKEAPMQDTETAAGIETRGWSTPDGTALAYENEETGDGRIFARGFLYWSDGPWPLQYADEMLMGHEGAELVGSIKEVTRNGDRIGGRGDIYLSRPAGADAVMLLEEGAPLGVSVDLDDVSVEFIDRTHRPEPEPAVARDEDEEWYAVASATFPSVSMLRLEDGSWIFTAQTAPEWTASGTVLSRAQQSVQIITGPGGRMTADAVNSLIGQAGTVTAAAGDPDTGDGLVIHSQNTGDLLMRVTRARLRGATLVAMPAYNRARIVLDPVGDLAASAVGDLELPVHDNPDQRWDGPGAKKRILAYATDDEDQVDADKLAQAYLYRDDEADPATASAYKLPFADVFDGELHIVPAGVYTIASVLQGGMGGVDLPPDDRDAIKKRVETLYARIGKALGDDSIRPPWTEEGGDEGAAAPKAAAASSEGHEQVVTFVRTSPVPVSASDVAKTCGMPVSTARSHLARAAEAGRLVRLARGLYVGPSSIPEGPDVTAAAVEEPEDELVASAWTAMNDMPPLPAAWFAEPTAEELPPGSGGVHYANGRVYGWVAQAGEPHAGIPGKKVTIDGLGAIDLTHFLRARFPLDDGTTMRVGAMTMNVGHHRDSSECETAACQFDNTRTVAAIVTVGMSAGGMWFSGAAAPWLSEWDRQVFAACQPSYHLRQAKPGGKWQLRAVLTVPVPGHSSPLLASVAERSNLAIAASAATVDTATDIAPDSPDTEPGQAPDAPDTATAQAADQAGQRPDGVGGAVAEAVAAVLMNPAVLDELAQAVEIRTQVRAQARAEIAALSEQVLTPAPKPTTTAPEGA